MRCSNRKCIDHLHTSMSFRTVCQYPADMKVLWRVHNQAPARIVKREYQTITGLLFMSIFWKTYSMPKWPDHPLTADLLFLNFLNPEHSSFWIIWDMVGCIRCIMPPYVYLFNFVVQHFGRL